MPELLTAEIANEYRILAENLPENGRQDTGERRELRQELQGRCGLSELQMQVGDVVHFRCKNHPLSGKGVVFMGKEVDGLGEDPFRIRDTRTGRNNGRIYPYYDDAVYRIDGREGE